MGARASKLAEEVSALGLEAEPWRAARSIALEASDGRDLLDVVREVLRRSEASGKPVAIG